MEIKYPGPKSISVNGRVLEFPQLIEDTVELPDRVLVLLNPDEFDYNDEFNGRNVMCIDKNGEVIWRILPCGGTRPDIKGQMVPEAYFNLWQDAETNRIQVAVPDVIYDLDPETGEISNGRLDRW